MGKVKWGIDDEPVDSTTFEPYEGPLPLTGVYIFAIKRLKMDESSNGNPMLRALLLVDGKASGKPEFDGAPVWDQVVVMPSTKWKVQQFCDALGVTMKDFVNATVVDDEDLVTKIGTVKITDKLRVRAVTKKGKDLDNEPRAEVKQYLPPKEGAATTRRGAAAAADAEPDDDGGIKVDDSDADSDSANAEDVWTREELDNMDDDQLQAIADESEIDVADVDRSVVINRLLGLDDDEMPEDEAPF